MMWYRILYWLKRGLYVVLAYVGLFLLVFTWQMIAAAVRNPDADLVDNSDLGKANRRTNTAAIV